MPTFSTNKTNVCKKVLRFWKCLGIKEVIRKVLTASLAMAFQLLLRNVEKKKKINKILMQGMTFSFKKLNSKSCLYIYKEQ